MAGRPYGERLLIDLREIRKALVSEVSRVTPEEFDTAPGEGMKSYKALLREIGIEEKETITWIVRRVLPNFKAPEWDSAWGDMPWTGEDLESALRDIATIRVETVQYLENASEEELETPIPLPEPWKEYFSLNEMEPEQLIQLVARHEYYHLGQIVTYRWLAGDNPYERS
jgi:uncharacterized damage-inducible protein DinB